MRSTIALLTIIIAATSTPSALACCLTNWMYGRTASPYAVGYAPAYAAGYAPVYSAGYAPVASSYAPVAAGYTANYPVATTSVLRPSWTGRAPVLTNGAYQAQRPAYYNNPSVYTGLPVTGAYQAARIPVATNLRGVTSSPTGQLGAANAYPSTYVSAYGAAQVPVTSAPGLPLSVTTPTGVPTSALPTTQAAPLFAPTVPRRGGLSRFFGSMFGTNYRSSYYRAPITYYRPATSVDPISGSTVTVQQPCTSYVQQLQRTPYNSLHGPTSTYVQPVPSCNTPAYGYGNTVPSSIGQAGAVGQASAIAPAAPGQFTVPIPSTAPTTGSGGYYGQGGFTPNAAPLTGAPGASPANQQPAGDDTPLNQPELRNRPPEVQNGYQPQPRQPEPIEPETTKPKSFWELQDAEDSTAMIRDSHSSQFRAEPISAPDDYVSPFRQELEAPTTPVNRKSFEAPLLPERSSDSVNSLPDANWVNTSVREASAKRTHSVSRPVARPMVRDTTWKASRR